MPDDHDCNNEKEHGAARPRSSRLRRCGAAIGALLVLLIVIAAWYLRTPEFQARVRLAVIERLEKSTGGRVELTGFHWNLRRLEIEVDNLTIHGLEAASDVPYAHVDHLSARLKVISLFSSKIGLRELSITRPIFHLIVYPDGTTNQPSPKLKQQSGDPVQQLFDLAIERAELKQGWLLLNERRIPLDLNADDVSAQMAFAAREKRYDAGIRVGKIDSKFSGMRPFSTQAEARFSIYPDRAELTSLSLYSGKAKLEASGLIQSFNDPRLEINYRFNGNVSEIASIMRLQDFRGGAIEINGRGQYFSRGFHSAGKLAAKNLNYDAALHFHDVSGGLEFELNQDRIVAPHIFVRALGGSAQGDGRIEHWLHAANAQKQAEQAGALNLKLTGLSAGKVAAAVSSRSIPLQTLNVAGSADGRLDITWQESIREALVRIQLGVVPPANPSPRSLPVTATVSAKYNAASSGLYFEKFSAVTPASKLDATGTLGRAGNLQFSVYSSNVGEFSPLIDALRPAGPIPLEVAGPASFTGTASGTAKSPSIAGHAELRNFTTLIPRSQQLAPEGAAQPVQPTEPVKLHWDQLSADLSYSPSRLSVKNGFLRRGSTQINLDGSSTLTKGSFSDDSALTAHLNVRGADVTELQSITGYGYPVFGKLDIQLQVAGMRNNLEGAGRIALTNASAYGQSVQSLTANVKFESQEARLRNISLLSDGAQVRGAASYNLQTTAFHFDLHGSDIRLERFPQINRPNLRTTGIASFDASGSGTGHAPVINGILHLRNLVLNGQPMGNLSADAVTQGADMRLTARSNFRNAEVLLDGDVRLRGDMPAHAVLTLKSPNVTPLLSAFVVEGFNGTAAVSARIEASGPLKNPRAMTVDVNADKLALSMEGITIQNQGPVRLHVANEVATIQQFRVEGEGNRFLEVNGSAELTGEQRLNFSAEGNVNLKLLQSVDPTLMSSGYTKFNFTVNGTVKSPVLRGRLSIEQGAISYIDLPNGLSDLNGTLSFNQDRLQVQQLTARTGGGLLNLGGYITYDRGIAFNLTASGRDIRIRYPEGVSAIANADLTLSGSRKNALLSGDVTVTRFALTPKFDLANFAARTKQTASTQNPNSPLNNVRLDVRVLSTEELQVQTSLAKVTGNVDLHLRGVITHPAVLGRVSIVEGDVQLNGTKYHLDRGDIRFISPVGVKPVLDLSASAHVRNYDINVGFQGDLDKLNTTYRSDPPLPTADIIALLALGRTREEAANRAMVPGSQQQTFTESASNALLGQALNAAVSSRVQKIFGVSRIKIDPQVGGPENNANARMTVEQQISNKVTLTYITNLTQSAQQVIQFEYNINRNVSIVGVRDQNGIVGIDVKVRQRRK